jgi:iron complex transport system substrate-binding protein
MRIVSLIASSTEIVHALGFGDDLVARSHECDHPPEVLALPAVTSPKLPTDGTSYEIDARLKAILQEGLSVYRVDAAALEAARPDVIVTQVQCEVCAVSLRDVEAALEAFVSSRPRIVALDPRCLEEVWADIRRVAAALGAPERGDDLVGRLVGRLAALSTAVSGRPRPRVACVDWIEPLMAAGNWMPELVELAGGENVVGQAGRHAPWLTWGELEAARPDVVCVMPCGFDLARTRAELTPRFRQLEARVVLCDGNAFMNRPGPRLVESAEILAEIAHGLDHGHRGTAWEEA